MKSTLVVMIAALGVSEAAVGQQKTTVPAFFGVSQQTDPSRGYDWTRIANQNTAVLAVVADGSFSGLPGDCSPVPTDCHASGVTGLCQAKCQFMANHNAGQLVLGYVDTNFACNPSNSVATQEAVVRAWHAAYPTQIQGVFYDDGPLLATSSCPLSGPNGGNPPLTSDAIQESDYKSIYAYEHNPPPNGYGGKVMLNASQYKNEWVMSDPAADYAVAFEGTYYNWVNNYYADQNNGQPAAWWTNASYQGKLAHIAFSATQNNVSTAVTRSRTATYGSPVVYLFDGTSTAYGGVSCFFEQQVAALQNQTPARLGAALAP